MSFPPWNGEEYDEIVKHVRRAAESLSVLKAYGFKLTISDEFDVVYTYQTGPYDVETQSPSVGHEPGVGWYWTEEG